MPSIAISAVTSKPEWISDENVGRGEEEKREYWGGVTGLIYSEEGNASEELHEEARPTQANVSQKMCG
jgi:hypothetical protein